MRLPVEINCTGSRSFGQGGARLAQVASRSFAAMVGSTSRKLRWLVPLDMLIERNHSRIDIPAIERSVRPTKSGDSAFQLLGLGLHVYFLSHSVASAQTLAGRNTNHSDY